MSIAPIQSIFLGFKKVEAQKKCREDEPAIKKILHFAICFVLGSFRVSI